MLNYVLEIKNIELKPLISNSTVTTYPDYNSALQAIDNQCALFSLMDVKQPDFFKRVQSQMKRYSRTHQLPKIYVHCENGRLIRVIFKLTQIKTIISFTDIFKETE